MSIFSKSVRYEETNEPGRQPRKPWSAMQIMLAILGGFMALGLLSMIHDRLHTQEADAATYPVEVAASARDDALAFHRQIAQVTMQCEFASGSLNVVMMSNDPVAIYQGAKAVDANCIGMSRKLEELTIPQTLGRQVAQTYAAALKQCKSAYLDRWSVAHSLEAALDSGGRVSALADLRSDMRDWKLSNEACQSALQAAPAPLGVTEADLFATLSNDAGAAPAGENVAAPSGYYHGNPTPAELALLKRWNNLTDECQGGDHEPNDRVCRARDQSYEKLRQAGWCFGTDDQPSADRVWQRCSAQARP